MGSVKDRNKDEKMKGGKEERRKTTRKSRLGGTRHVDSVLGRILESLFIPKVAPRRVKIGAKLMGHMCLEGER